MAHGDDAGVFRVRDDLALVQTVDVFTPVVDDPRDFGAISAANSLSDCYAMGATPISCLSIMVVPSVGFPDGVVEDILRGANEVCQEAGAPLIGGHSLKLPEPAFGLAVTGIVHPDKVVRPDVAKPGDALILTKPLGTGIITTAAKKGNCSPDALEKAVKSMRTLNKTASIAMATLPRKSATDVTGFGLLGHLHHILEASGVGARISFSALPILRSALELAGDNSPGGTHGNLRFAQNFTDFGDLTEAERLLLCDAQTSGGLLIVCPPSEADELVGELKTSGCEECSKVGEIVSAEKPIVLVNR